MRRNLVPAVLLIVLIVLALLLFGAAPAQAQVEVTPGVARISLIHGDVSTQRGDSGDWSVAALNAPIVSGDKIAAGERSRAEVQLDFANVLRLDGNSQAAIAGLTRTRVQVQLSRGLLDYVVFKDSEADVEINTPNVAVRPTLREGVYRIEVNSEGDTRVIVRKGEAEIATQQGSSRVQKGELATIRGSGSETEYKIADAPSKDDWDSWNNSRDNVIREARSWGYTNRYYTGAEDLDAYGRWTTVPDYGPVWVPAVQVGWAPYRLGRWVWEPYWGWTWVSYEPWGWAPYHYGRWFMYAGSWAWWPGPVHRHYRPLWAPAYVSFFGFGGGFGVSVGFGSVGWLPIGPCDRYYPWYGGYRSHFNVVNIVNIHNYRGEHGHDGWAPLHRGDGYSNLRLAMHDVRIRDGMSVIPGDRFGTGRFEARAPDRDMFHNAHVVTGNLPIVPTRAALSVSDRPAERLGDRGGHERFFTRGRPNTAPVPFDREAAQVQEAIQRSGRFTPVRAEGRGEPNPARQENSPIAHRVPDSLRREMPQGENRQAQSDSGRALPERGHSADAVSGREWHRFGDVAQGQAPAPARTQQNPSSPTETRTAPGRGTRAPEQTASPQAHPQPQQQPQQHPESGGWRRFSDRDTTPRPDRSGTGDRPSATPQTSSPERNQTWRQPERDSRPATADTPNAARDQWRRFPAERPQSESVRQDAPASRAPRAERPPLDLRQPIVRPRAERGGGSGPSGGAQAQPSHGGSQAQPSRGGSQAQPSRGQSGGRSGEASRPARPSGERKR